MAVQGSLALLAVKTFSDPEPLSRVRTGSRPQAESHGSPELVILVSQTKPRYDGIEYAVHGKIDSLCWRCDGRLLV